MQALFVLNSNSDAAQTTVLSAVLAQQQPDEATIPPYLADLVRQTLAHQAAVDEKISAHLKKGWTLKRLSRVDLVILRLAIAEKDYVQPDLSANVVINEALQLSKEFGDDQTRPFINAVLQKIIAA